MNIKAYQDSLKLKTHIDRKVPDISLYDHKQIQNFQEVNLTAMGKQTFIDSKKGPTKIEQEKFKKLDQKHLLSLLKHPAASKFEKDKSDKVEVKDTIQVSYGVEYKEEDRKTGQPGFRKKGIDYHLNPENKN